MPIRKDLRKFYASPEWLELRERIRKRAGDRCESCGKPQGEVVFTYTWKTRMQWSGRWEYFMIWMLEDWRIGWRTEHNYPVSPWNAKGLPRRLLVMLTVAHLDHDHQHNDDANLRLLCTWCHLNHDQPKHRETRSIRKDAGRVFLTSPSAVA